MGVLGGWAFSYERGSLYAPNLQPYALNLQPQTGTADDLVYRDAKEKGDPTAKKMYKTLVSPATCRAV